MAEAALQAGADLVNDIWGLKYDSRMAMLIARYDAACCLMHNRKEPVYQDFFADFMEDMRECVRIAMDASIAKDKMILDPGVGFGKTYEMNLAVIREVGRLKELGYPILLGTSRNGVWDAAWMFFRESPRCGCKPQSHPDDRGNLKNTVSLICRNMMIF